jgi:hypothetical protein
MMVESMEYLCQLLFWLTDAASQLRHEDFSWLHGFKPSSSPTQYCAFASLYTSVCDVMEYLLMKDTIVQKVRNKEGTVQRRSPEATTTIHQHHGFNCPSHNNLPWIIQNQRKSIESIPTW